jgi:hypothetical protein
MYVFGLPRPVTLKGRIPSFDPGLLFNQDREFARKRYER